LDGEKKIDSGIQIIGGIAVDTSDIVRLE